MGRVDVAEDVGLECGVHGYDAESAYHLGVVGDLHRAEHQMLLEEVDVADHLVLDLVAHRERAGRAEFAAALLHEVDHGILHHLGVHLERRDLLGVGQTVEHGVGHVAHARLDGEERRGDASGFDLADEEAAHVGTDHLGGLVERSERLDTLVVVAHHHADNLLGVDLQHGRADAVAGLEDGYLAAVGGIEGQIYVMQSVEGVAQLLVELDDHALGHLGDGGDVAHAGAYDYCAVILNVADFDDGDVDVANLTVAQLLGGLREVEVEIVRVMRVDALAQVGMVLIGGAAADGVGTGEYAVTLV